jgi:hypothetical protein
MASNLPGGDGSSGIKYYDSPLKLAPTVKKPRLSINFEKCILCQLVLGEKLTLAGDKGLCTIQAAAELRNDQVTERLKSQQHSQGPVYYHRSCFASYCSKTNLSYTRSSDSSKQPETHCTQSELRTTRSASSSTDWTVCVVCRRKQHKKDRVLHKIQTTAGEVSLKDAANKRKDRDMLRLIENEDLIACEALYHNGCLSTYKNERNIIAFHSKCDSDLYSVAFHQLIAEIHVELIENKKAFTMSSLLDRFRDLLPDEVDDQAYRSKNLQDRLISHYGDEIIIQSQHGQAQSNYVFSKSVSLADAIRTAKQLKESLKSYQREEDLIADECEGNQSDLSILHKAVGILRREMNNLQLGSDGKNYPSAQEISIEASEKYVPPLLAKTMLWLIDKEAYNSCEDQAKYTPTLESKRRSLSLAECLIFNNNKSNTPLHTGLAVQMHHDYGKRGIIDTLFSHGFCISYDELRRFMTAIAQDQIARIEAGTYVPINLIPMDEGGQMIHEGADNIDINAETIDGKNTFHSMGRVVFQKQSTDQPSRQPHVIKPSRQKSLNTETCKPLTQCLTYQKPAQRPEPPRRDNAMQLMSSCGSNTEPEHNLAWLLMRNLSRGILSLPDDMVIPDIQTIPFWTGYNYILAEQETTQTCVTYKPIIDAPPTDLSTVYTTMKQCQEMCASLGQPYSVQTMDQQLYALAQQIKWNKHIEFQSHFPRLGGFHKLCTFIAAIGQIWGDAGLRDILVDSNVFAANTADQMLLGKQFHRAVRGLTLTYEALMTLLISRFQQWTDEHKHQVPSIVWDQLEDAHKSIHSDNHHLATNSVKELESVLTLHISPLLDQFKEWGAEKSQTFQFWMMFLDVCEILLQNIHAERAGEWSKHLKSIFKMLPYMFAANRVNYARWLPTYLLDMISIPDELKAQFEDGQFTVRETSRCFNGIWSDMATEKTIIRDSKGNSGIVGLTRKEPALVRWSLTRHILGEFASRMKERSGTEASPSPGHAQSQPAAMKRDEQHTLDIISHIQTNMTNPFDVSSHPETTLVNISSGLHASKEVQDSLLGTLGTGQKQLETFVQDCLSTGSNKSFYSPIHKSGVKTFTDMAKKTKLLHNGKTVKVSIGTELVFRRALTLSGIRENVTTETILSLPVTSVPTAIFHEDGTMRKCQKSDLMHKLETKTTKRTNLIPYDTSRTVVITDAMADLQNMKIDNCKTFDSLAQTYLDKLCVSLDTADTVVVACDRYDDPNSVKSQERERRGDTAALKTYQVIGGRAVPPWQKFLALSSNKSALINFLGEYIAQHGPRHLKLVNSTAKKLVISGAYNDGKITKCINFQGSQDCPDQSVCHEEADTRILFHACKADRELHAQGYQGRIIIKSPDTDVIVLAVHYYPQMTNVEELWLVTGRITGTTDQRRYIAVHEICNACSPLILQILPAVHAITGCDSVSSFFKIGKKSVMKVIEDKGAEFFKDLANFSKGDLDLVAARQLVSALYDPKGKKSKVHSSLNSMRVQMASKKDVALAQLPPAEASFQQHVLRASWQTKVWLASHVANPELGTPDGNGWKRHADCLVPVLFEGPTAAEVLQGLLCSCSERQNCSRDCGCQKSGLACCEACPCGATESCGNVLTHEIDTTED